MKDIAASNEIRNNKEKTRHLKARNLVFNGIYRMSFRNPTREVQTFDGFT